MLLLWINVRTQQQEDICKQVKFGGSDGLNVEKMTKQSQHVIEL